jgi:methionine synthase / methylenetetrahydrofolate reductase(NADPH)
MHDRGRDPIGITLIVRSPQTRPDIRKALAGRVLVCDGAMGTMLHAGGVSLDRSLPELNVSHPDLVRTIHRAYIDAGAQVIETNTFGASRFRLARHGLEERTAEINRAGVRLAREACEQHSTDLLVAGSVGPATPAGLGHRLTPKQLRDAFREQIAPLFEGGIDLLMLETFGSLPEIVDAVSVANALGSVPVVAQMTFVEDGRTLGGDSPEEVASTLEGLGVVALGANCTLGPQGLLDVLSELARWTNLPLTAQPNAGPPTLTEGQFQYTADPGYFARHARRFVQLGATLVGGCCGTTPTHVKAVAEAVADLEPVIRRPVSVQQRAPIPAPGAHGGPAASSSRFAQRLQSGEFVLACELPSPAGADAEHAVHDALELEAAGCSAIVVAPVGSARAQVSPASLALLVQQRVPGLEAILTATTWEKSLMVLQADLLGAHAFGIRSIVCRTGTPPLQADYPNAAGIWDVDSLGLIEVLRGLNEGRDYNGIPLGRPTGFVIGARVNPSADDIAREAASARRKIAAGATFLVTPPAYDLIALDRLIDAVDAPNVPVLLGVMALQNLRHAEYLQHEVPEMSVPESVLERMWQAGERGPLVGIQIACELAAEARADGRVQGLVLATASGSTDELVTLLQSLSASA